MTACSWPQAAFGLFFVARKRPSQDNALFKTPCGHEGTTLDEVRWSPVAGSFALIPFKVDYLEMFDLPMYILGGSGVVLLLRATQKIGWHLVLEGNVLYYSKFNMYASWKRIRSQEFALSQDKITKVIVTSTSITLHYEPGRMLTFSTLGLDNAAKERLVKLERALQPKG